MNNSKTSNLPNSLKGVSSLENSYLKNDMKMKKSSSSNSLSKLDKTRLDSKNVENFNDSIMGGREAIASLLMKEREVEYTNFHTYRVYCGTWNVNGQQAIELNNWLCPSQPEDPQPPHIYAIGFQELDLSKNVYIFNESAREDDWLQKIEKSLHPGAKYIKIKQIRLVAMLLVVYIVQELEEHVTDLCAEYVGTGILGMMGNKGGVAVRMQLHATKICFVNSHLAAHMDEFQRRNQDYREISSRLVFRIGSKVVTIADHDLIFWIGDLNYRITGLDVEKCKLKIEKSQFDELIKFDQLTQQMKGGMAFLDYKEGTIYFKPTYKYDTNSDTFDTSEKCRIPAWCDRILWRGDHVTQIFYQSHQQFLLSDHKPVSSLFYIGTKVYDLTKERRVREDVMKKLDQKENDFLPQVKLEPLELVFKDVRFLEEQQRILSITNTGQVPVQFEFINKPMDKIFCKFWLRVQPSFGFIHIGDKVNIIFEVRVDTKSVGLIDPTKNVLEDILVFHLQGGKDFFITVGGNFIPGCFGCSINQLVQIRYPVATPEGLQALKASSTNDGEVVFAIPKELWLIVNFLNEYALVEEKLFRVDGYDSEIRLIKRLLDTSSDILPSSLGSHSMASALILFLNSLSEPVIPYKYYFACVESKTLGHASMIMEKIPIAHQNVFKYLCSFLKKLLVYSNHNRLDVNFLGTLFGNILLRPPDDIENLPFNRMDPETSESITNEGRQARFIIWFLMAPSSSD